MKHKALRVLLNRYALASGFDEWEKRLVAQANEEYKFLADVFDYAEQVAKIAPSGDWQIFEDDNNIKLMNLAIVVEKMQEILTSDRCDNCGTYGVHDCSESEERRVG